MTEIEKANELIDVYYYCENCKNSQLDIYLYYKEKIRAIDHSLICVNEILSIMENPYATEFGYWLNVKKELNNQLEITTRALAGN